MANMTAQGIADNNSRKEEAAEQRGMVNNLERSAGIAHEALRRSQEEAARDAKQAALEAKLAAAHNTELLAAMQADSNALKGVFIDLIKNARATLSLGNTDGGGLDVSPEVVNSSYVEVMDQLEGSAAKRARAEEDGAAPDVTNEEEIAEEESAKLEEQLRLVQLSKKAAKAKAKAEAKAAAKATTEGEAMRVDEAGARIDYRKPCEHGSNLLGHNSGIYGNGCNGSSYYDRPVNPHSEGVAPEGQGQGLPGFPRA